VPHVLFYAALGAIVFGIAVVVLREFGTVYRMLTRRHGWDTFEAPAPLGSESAETLALLKEVRNELVGDGQPTPSVFRFDRRSLILDRPFVDLTGLFPQREGDEPSFTVRVNLTNVSGYPVTISGVDGQMSVDGRPCLMARTRPIQRHRFNDASDYRSIEIEQPVSAQMHEYMVRPAMLGAARTGLADPNSALGINLNGLRLTGQVHGPNGDEELRDCHIYMTLTVRGPVTDIESARRVTLWEGIVFADSQRYDQLGRVRETSAQ